MCEADFQIYSIILAEVYNVITINSFFFLMIHQLGDVIFLLSCDFIVLAHTKKKVIECLTSKNVTTELNNKKKYVEIRYF